MNALQSFLSTLPCGFITSAQLPDLIKLDRLHPCLVRCGACRFTCAAQDVLHLLACIDAGGDYVRDVSIPSGCESRAAAWLAPEATVTPLGMMPASFTAEPAGNTASGYQQAYHCDDGEEWRGDHDSGL